MTRVLILMATYNGAAFLRAQLDSLAAQTHQDWALWVSDDGSSDQTREIVQAFARDVTQPVRLVDGPGQGVARNFLSMLCHPDIPHGPENHVAFCDQDDIWYPDKLSRALERTSAVEGPAIYGARYDLIDADGVVFGEAPSLPADGIRPHDPFLWTVVGGLTTVLNPAAVALMRQAGAVDVPYHDWWASLVIAACGGALVLDDRRVMGYRQHGANVIGASGRRGAARRRISGVLDGTYGSWVRRNAEALATAELPLTDPARDVAEGLRRPQGALARVRFMWCHRLRRRDRIGTLAAYLAALIGRL